MPSPQFDASAQPSLSDAINKLMANPEIISMVASTLGNMNTSKREANEDGTAKIDEASNTQAEADAPSLSDSPQQSSNSADLGAIIKSLSPIVSSLNSTEGKSTQTYESDSRLALLRALKPYVSESRREAIDYIIRISQVSELLKTIPNQS